MYNQADRCDRTAYVSGLQNSITDIELFEFFNKVSHVEKVILRNGIARHALVVFKSVEGLYKALVEFNKCYLHGRQLHIRPLRESSHANNEMINAVCESSSRHHNRRLPTQERFCPPPPNNSFPQNMVQNRACTGGARNPVNSSFGRRKLSNSRNNFQTESYGSSVNGVNIPQFAGFNTDHIPFEDYSEGAHRFDNLANVVRSCQPSDPYLNRILKEKALYPPVEPSRSRSNSTRDSSAQKSVPPTWKMELQIKKNDVPDPADMMKEQLPYHETGKISAEEFMAKFVSMNQNQHGVGGEKGKKKRPNLSVINPSLFYEQYPRTSSPVTHQVEGCRYTPRFADTAGNPQSPHDPAVLAYRRLRAPTTFDGVSPIDTNNCSFVTKHLGSGPEQVEKVALPRHEMTNEELSDMIVSTGNLRINPVIASHFDEPAPWSPVKRLRAESGSLSMAQVASPQFSPINVKCTDFNETEDEVFNTENNCVKKNSVASENKRRMERISFNKSVLTEQKLPNFEDINNSRLPSNSHSANPNSGNREFSFPPNHFCRHTSVPSLTNFVGDMSDYGSNSPHLTAGIKYEIDDTSVFTDYQSSSAGKSWDMSMPKKPNGSYQVDQHVAFENMVMKP